MPTKRAGMRASALPRRRAARARPSSAMNHRCAPALWPSAVICARVRHLAPAGCPGVHQTGRAIALRATWPGLLRAPQLAPAPGACSRHKHDAGTRCVCLSKRSADKGGWGWSRHETRVQHAQTTVSPATYAWAASHRLGVAVAAACALGPLSLTQQAAADRRGRGEGRRAWRGSPPYSAAWSSAQLSAAETSAAICGARACAAPAPARQLHHAASEGCAVWPMVLRAHMSMQVCRMQMGFSWGLLMSNVHVACADKGSGCQQAWRCCRYSASLQAYMTLDTQSRGRACVSLSLTHIRSPVRIRLWLHAPRAAHPAGGAVQHAHALATARTAAAPGGTACRRARPPECPPLPGAPPWAHSATSRLRRARGAPPLLRRARQLPVRPGLANHACHTRVSQETRGQEAAEMLAGRLKASQVVWDQQHTPGDACCRNGRPRAGAGAAPTARPHAAVAEERDGRARGRRGGPGLAAGRAGRRRQVQVEHLALPRPVPAAARRPPVRRRAGGTTRVLVARGLRRCDA